MTGLRISPGGKCCHPGVVSCSPRLREGERGREVSPGILTEDLCLETLVVVWGILTMGNMDD